MLVINGFFEKGVFVPEEPLVNIEGKQRAVLKLEEECLSPKSAQKRIGFLKGQITIPADFDQMGQTEIAKAFETTA